MDHNQAAAHAANGGWQTRLEGTVPRAADGKPDLSGIWRRAAPSRRTNNTDNFDLLDWMPASATIRMKPAAAALYQHRRDVLLGAGRPSQQCLPHSIPDAETYLEPFTLTIPFDLQPDTELIEHICENERDSAEIPAK